MIYCMRQPSLYDHFCSPHTCAGAWRLLELLQWRMFSGGRLCEEISAWQQEVWDIRYASIWGKRVGYAWAKDKRACLRHSLGLSVFLIYVQICWCFTLNDQKLKPGRWDKKTPIWLLQRMPPENSLLHQLEMHRCDKRASWIQTQQSHLLAVSFNFF